MERESKEQQILAFVMLRPGTIFSAEDIEKHMGWDKGVASSILSRLFYKKKLERQDTCKSSSGRTCYGYSYPGSVKASESAPLPSPRDVVSRQHSSNEVFEIIRKFLRTQDKYEYFSGSFLEELFDGDFSIFPHLSSLTKKGFLERKKLRKGKRGQNVYCYRLTIRDFSGAFVSVGEKSNRGHEEKIEVIDNKKQKRDVSEVEPQEQKTKEIEEKADPEDPIREEQVGSGTLPDEMVGWVDLCRSLGISSLDDLWGILKNEKKLEAIERSIREDLEKAKKEVEKKEGMLLFIKEGRILLELHQAILLHKERAKKIKSFFQKMNSFSKD